MRIYLDYAATTPVREEVLKAMLPYFSDKFGNPGSINSFGIEAAEAVDEARLKIAKLLNAKLDQIIFAGSGTESVNLAIKGAASANKSKGNHIITSKIEHKAVLETCKYLEKHGFEVTYLEPEKDGTISKERLKEAIKPSTILISIMHANNEIGSINPIKELKEISKNILFHTDASQSAGLLEIPDVDLVTINSAKIYGPKGIALLKTKTKLEPLIHGGEQEFGLRSGTENVPGIVGFSKALELAFKEKDIEYKRLENLKNKLINGLLKLNATLNSPKNSLPNNINISFKGVEAETLLLSLDDQGVAVATGSACTTKTLKHSHVLEALRLPKDIIQSSIRITIGKYTTEEQIGQVIEIVTKIIKDLKQ
ncbi:MAG: cysteine desulfurase family protein [Candidatus Nanoarchaeia archaeon]|nr:cysteine desulfurase family protein [Candidatus Nanoarchaeia archaeon]